mmetsp:Transcript_39431/g.97367  ORF Transcript_39431/g.97367 Transcript_39431/m.97367 type:complete len:225 (-) Transcript_39431:366-1040(-)
MSSTSTVVATGMLRRHRSLGSEIAGKEVSPEPGGSTLLLRPAPKVPLPPGSPDFILRSVGARVEMKVERARASNLSVNTQSRAIASSITANECRHTSTRQSTNQPPARILSHAPSSPSDCTENVTSGLSPASAALSSQESAGLYCVTSAARGASSKCEMSSLLSAYERLPGSGSNGSSLDATYSHPIAPAAAAASTRRPTLHALTKAPSVEVSRTKAPRTTAGS